MFKKLIVIMTFTAVFASCKTLDIEDSVSVDAGKSTEKLTKLQEEALVRYEKEQEKKVAVLEEEEQEPKVIYIRQPVYEPAPEPAPEVKNGKEAVIASTNKAIQHPQSFQNGAMYYDYQDDFVYEIFCQPYRVTDLQLEPGEQVLEKPFLSENKVWEIGAGVSRIGNTDTQHFFLKPASSTLVTSMIIITDKRVYHLLLKSYKDAYMSIVKWNYPMTSMPFKLMNKGSNNLTAGSNKKNGVASSLEGLDVRYLSFDYKVKYSGRKPLWLPTMVFDDGRKTYIRMNEVVLHRETPVLFEGRKQLIDYYSEGNFLVINSLIEKLTLRRKNKKITIIKKRADKSELYEDEIMAEKDKKEKTISDEKYEDEVLKLQKKGVIIGSDEAEYQRLLQLKREKELKDAISDKKVEKAN